MTELEMKLKAEREHMKLIDKVRAIDTAAAGYIIFEAPKLRTFVKIEHLHSMFIWSNTPQGHKYWHDISKQVDNDFLQQHTTFAELYGK